MKKAIFKKALLVCAILIPQCVFSNNLKLEHEVEKSKVRVDLAGLYARDQAIRYELMALEEKGYSTKKLSFHSAFASYWNTVDRQNVVELKRIIAKHGWPSTSSYGPVTEQSAWIIAQHASFDIAFQKRVLKYIKNEPNLDQFQKQHIALLEDRILSQQGLPQIYGTQSRCVGFHKSESYPIKDFAHVNQRRLAIGMPSYEDYQKEMDKVCF